MEKLSEEIKGLPTVSQFKSKLFLFIRPIKRSVFGISNIHGIKLLTKLRIEFSDLRSPRFEHNFNCVDPRCSCLLEDKSNPHYLLRCPHYLHLRRYFLGDIPTIVGSDISVLPRDHLTDILLFGSNVYNNVTNKAKKKVCVVPVTRPTPRRISEIADPKLFLGVALFLWMDIWNYAFNDNSSCL